MSQLSPAHQETEIPWSAYDNTPTGNLPTPGDRVKLNVYFNRDDDFYVSDPVAHWDWVRANGEEAEGDRLVARCSVIPTATTASNLSTYMWEQHRDVLLKYLAETDEGALTDSTARTLREIVEGYLEEGEDRIWYATLDDCGSGSPADYGIRADMTDEEVLQQARIETDMMADSFGYKYFIITDVEACFFEMRDELAAAAADEEEEEASDV